MYPYCFKLKQRLNSTHYFSWCLFCIPYLKITCAFVLFLCVRELSWHIISTTNGLGPMAKTFYTSWPLEICISGRIESFRPRRGYIDTYLGLVKSVHTCKHNGWLLWLYSAQIKQKCCRNSQFHGSREATAFSFQDFKVILLTSWCQITHHTLWARFVLVTKQNQTLTGKCSKCYAWSVFDFSYFTVEFSFTCWVVSKWFKIRSGCSQWRDTKTRFEFHLLRWYFLYYTLQIKRKENSIHKPLIKTSFTKDDLLFTSFTTCFSCTGVRRQKNKRSFIYIFSSPPRLRDFLFTIHPKQD